MFISHISYSWSIFLFILPALFLEMILKVEWEIGKVKMDPKKNHPCNKGKIQDVLLLLFFIC